MLQHVRQPGTYEGSHCLSIWHYAIIHGSDVTQWSPSLSGLRHSSAAAAAVAICNNSPCVWRRNVFLVINPVDNLFRRSIATLSCCFFAPNWLALFASACCLIISRTILWRTNCVGCATQKDPPAFRGAPPSCQKPLAPILGFGIMYPLQNRGQKQHAQHADNL